MNDCEALACADVGLLDEVGNANNLLKACVPQIQSASKACMELHKRMMKSAAMDDAAKVATSEESENAAMRYKMLCVLIEELTKRYA